MTASNIILPVSVLSEHRPTSPNNENYSYAQLPTNLSAELFNQQIVQDNIRITTKKTNLKYQTPKILEILRNQSRKDSRQKIIDNFNSTLSKESESYKKEKVDSRKYSSVLKSKFDQNSNAKDATQDFALIIAKDMRANSTIGGGSRRNFRISNTAAIN